MKKTHDLTVSEAKVQFLREVVSRYKESSSDIQQSVAEGIKLALEILGLEKEEKADGGNKNVSAKPGTCD